MDIEISFKKYFENYKIILAYSILFIFLLFTIDPLFTIFGGTLNLSYDILNTNIINIILTIITSLILLVIYSVIQTILIYKIKIDYKITDIIYFKDIKNYFYKILKFNWLFFLIIYGLSVFLYNIMILNNTITQIIFLLITIIVWFVPQAIIIHNKTIGYSILFSIYYIKKEWFHLITLFAATFVLIGIASIIDAFLGPVVGSVLSLAFLVLFTIPFIEILKTELFLNKYKLLKPTHQIKGIKRKRR
jgi:hypothetical protein